MCIVAATGQCGILQNNILHDSASESDTYANSSSTKMIRNIRKQTHSDRWRHSMQRSSAQLLYHASLFVEYTFDHEYYYYYDYIEWVDCSVRTDTNNWVTINSIPLRPKNAFILR